MYGMSIIPLIYSLFFYFFLNPQISYSCAAAVFDRRLLELIPQFIHADLLLQPEPQRPTVAMAYIWL